MFDRLARTHQARHALKRGEFALCLRLLEDPELRPHRSLERLRERAIRGWAARGLERLGAGDLSGARSDLEGLASAPDGPNRIPAAAAEAVRHLESAIGVAEKDRSELVRQIEDWSRRVRSELDRGRLTRAVAEFDRGPDTALVEAGRDRFERERQGLIAAIEQRRRRARLVGEALEAAAVEGDALAVVEGWLRLRGLDPEDPVAERLRPEVLGAIDRLANVGELSETLWNRCEADPELAGRFPPPGGGPDGLDPKALAQLVRDWAASVDDERVIPAFDWSAFDASVERLSGDAESLSVLRAVGRLGRRGRVEASIQLLDGHDFRGAEEPIQALRTALQLAEAICRETLTAAGTAVRESRVADAKPDVLRALTVWPEHEAFLDLLTEIEALEDRWEARFRELRELQRQGRLRQALDLARSQTAAGDFAATLHGLEVELERRQELVQNSLAEVERQLQMPSRKPRAELERAVGRLDELEQVQADSPALQRLRSAVTAEQRGNELLDQMRGLVEGGSVADSVACLEEFTGLRSELLSEDRLRAREAEIAESARNRARRSLDRGEVAACLGWLQFAATLPGEERQTSGDVLERSALGRKAAAERLATEARRALEAGQIDRARDLLTEARDQGGDLESVQALEPMLFGGSEEARMLAQAKAEQERGDFDAANRTLRSMGATPAALRSRVFDFKRSLAEAQGFGDVFLLRVDDAGEFLVVRGESVTIGNLQEAVADLPMLARLRGVHARLRRSMSFHGGLSDRVDAEVGSLFDADGARQDRIQLTGRTRFRLGESVELDYERRSERSLTANLQVRAGFRVGSCDRLLWMKDRGRDGRILIGPARDAHVRVPSARAEVEIYAERDGRLFVHSDDGATIDGREVRGRHPVPPGGVIRAEGIELVLLPWSRPGK